MRHILLLLAMATLFACTGPAPDEAKPEAMAASQETSHDETQEAEDSHKAHWGYGETDGPEMWSSLSPDFALCAEGTTQSPIDLTDATTGDEGIEVRKNLPPVSMTFVRKEHIADILDNGHTLQVTYDEAATAELNGKAYSLAQLHFHAPSEHTIDGQSFPMETHFVYTTEDGTLLVVGVLVDEGKPNDAFEPILARLPADVGESTHLEGLGVNVDDLVPPGGQYFRYRGSLTTPPCSEGVAWFVRQEPIEFSAEQIGSIAQIIASNNRPVQPLNERSLVLDSPNYIE